MNKIIKVELFWNLVLKWAYSKSKLVGDEVLRLKQNKGNFNETIWCNIGLSSWDCYKLEVCINNRNSSILNW